LSSTSYLDLVDWIFLALLTTLAGFSIYQSAAQLGAEKYSPDRKVQLKRSVVSGTLMTIALLSIFLIVAICGGSSIVSIAFWNTFFPLLACILLPFWIITTIGSNLQYETQEWMRKRWIK
jgi:O-antigen/teichoic acid export membrane protein